MDLYQNVYYVYYYSILTRQNRFVSAPETACTTPHRHYSPSHRFQFPLNCGTLRQLPPSRPNRRSGQQSTDTTQPDQPAARQIGKMRKQWLHICKVARRALDRYLKADKLCLSRILFFKNNLYPGQRRSQRCFCPGIVCPFCCSVVRVVLKRSLFISTDSKSPLQLITK